MTTISRNKRNRQRSYGTWIAILFIAVFAIAVIFFRSELAGMLRGALPLASPLQEGLLLERQGFVALFSSKAALEAENTQLRELLASTTAALLDRNALHEENEALKKLLGRHGTSTSSTLGRVVMRPPGTPYDTLLIDAGLAEGVREGDRVIAGGIAVGTISEVSRATARVTLLSAPGAKGSAELRLSQGEVIPVTIEGVGSGSLKGEVPAGTPVASGNEILISDAKISYVGTVSHVEKTEGSSFQTIYLHLPVNIFELQFVEVLHTPILDEN